MKRSFTTRKSFSEIEKLSVKELRREYTTLRDIFQKRIKRLEQAGSERAKPYLSGAWAYIPTLAERAKIPGLRNLTEDQKRGDLIFAVKELTNLVGRSERNLPASGVLSITGLRRQRSERETGVLNALHEAGYERISKSTLRNFGRFMDAMREQYGKKLPNSEEMAEFFDSLKYNTKRRSTQFIVDLWREYERNGYQSDYGSQDLFAT